MNNMTEDLANFVSYELYLSNYWRNNNAGKINLLKETLNGYTAMKLKSNFNIDIDRNIEFDEMMLVLEQVFSLDQDKEKIFFNYTSFILGVMSNLQQHELNFSTANIDNIIEIKDDDGKVNQIIFPEEKSPCDIAIDSFNILKNHFQNNEKSK